MKLFQLNLYGGKYLSNAVDFIHKENPDIIHFQEVTGGAWGYHPDVFKALQSLETYRVQMAVAATIKNDTSSYIGNAVLYKKFFSVESTAIFFMKSMPPYEKKPEGHFDEYPRNGIDVCLNVEGKKIHFVNVHMVWGPTPHDEPYKVEQHNRCVEFIKNIHDTWVLSGDFNVTPDSNLVKELGKLGNDLAKNLDYPNTLNQNTHKAKHLFPGGLAVDYIFTSKDVYARSIKLIDQPDLSDHYGYMLEFDP